MGLNDAEVKKQVYVMKTFYRIFSAISSHLFAAKVVWIAQQVRPSAALPRQLMCDIIDMIRGGIKSVYDSLSLSNKNFSETFVKLE